MKIAITLRRLFPTARAARALGLAALLGLGLAAAGCGKKGALYLPPQASPPDRLLPGRPA
jgi:hypothetical protein